MVWLKRGLNPCLSDHWRTLYSLSGLNFWDEACWFLSLKVFGLLSSSLLFYFLPVLIFFRVKPPTVFNMTKNCVCSIPCSCGKIYKCETGLPLKVRLEEHRKAVIRGEFSVKDVVRRFNKGRSSKFREVPEFDNHLKKAGEHIGRNVVEITIKMKTIVRKLLMIKLYSLDNVLGNSWNHLTIFKQMSSGSFKTIPTNYLFIDNIYLYG